MKVVCPNCAHAGLREQSCPVCLKRGAFITMRPPRAERHRGATEKPVAIGSVHAPTERRILTPWGQVNALLNGGIVRDSTMLLAGRPGYGKSTFALQVAAASGLKAIYIAGEEAAEHVRARYDRVCGNGRLDIWERIDLEAICPVIGTYPLAVVDSLQVLYAGSVHGNTGGPVQMRGALIALTRLAHERRTTILILSHANQKGQPAGSLFHQHLVDAVLVFRGRPEDDTRELYVQKYRHGRSLEALPMRMTATGLEVVTA